MTSNGRTEDVTSGGSGDRVRVYLEAGRTWVFAAALDWPGWCRRGKGEEAALAALADHAGRYALVAGPGLEAGEPEVVGRVTGTRTTDFGAPDVRGPWDDEPWAPGELDHQLGLLIASWDRLDHVVAHAPAELRKGPRGGGRDRDAVASHVREAERAYASRAGRRIPPRTPWPEQRTLLLDGLRDASPEAAWPARYAIRRIAWHVLDHAWEIEDRST